jgi:hypothetical protein
VCFIASLGLTTDGRTALVHFPCFEFGFEKNKNKDKNPSPITVQVFYIFYFKIHSIAAASQHIVDSFDF